jgi:hypothetical protein
MKKLTIIILAISLLFSCDSAQKAMQRGAYEQACYMAVKKLQKKPDDSQHAEILALAYQKSNQADMDRIDYLQLSGDEHGYDEIYSLYSKLDKRQAYVETVLPLRAGGKTVNFEHINYNAKILEAKNSAGDFHYNKGIELMSGDKNQCREAYDHLIKAKQYKSNYLDIDRKIMDAKERGTTHVLISPLNKTYAQLSPEYLGRLVDISLNNLDDKWTRYYNTTQRDYYDYTIFVSISSIYISPSDNKEVKEIVKKDVKDGWKYEYDSKGNVKKDTAGNDIKVVKYKTISCTLTKKEQRKHCIIKINIETQDNNTRRILSTIPEQATYNFYYYSSFANGDLNALDEETRNTLGRSPIAFPNDMEMINSCTLELKPKIENIIKYNRKNIN